MNYTEFIDKINLSIKLLHAYLSEKLLQEFGVAYTNSPRVIGYNPSANNAPYCGSAQPGANNAMYCRGDLGDFIAWDEPFVLRFFAVGDFAAAFVVAHEWGHAIQWRLGWWSLPTVRKELMADCFAGSWARWPNARGNLEPGDLDESLGALYKVGDRPGTPWTDPMPMAAHSCASIISTWGT